MTDRDPDAAIMNAVTKAAAPTRRLFRVVAGVASVVVVLAVLVALGYGILYARHARQVEINRGVDVRLCQVLNASIDRTQPATAGELRLRRDLGCGPRRTP